MSTGVDGCWGQVAKMTLTMTGEPGACLSVAMATEAWLPGGPCKADRGGVFGVNSKLGKGLTWRCVCGCAQGE